MSSINTNLSAITALQSLKSTQNAMNKNQSQISTGLRVGEASHNASYWSISTKMKSDNGALGAVKDSIKQSKAMIDTYSSALDKTLGYLNKIKTGLVAAKQPGADITKIQTEFKANIAGLRSAAESASFNGQNWLKASTSTESLKTQVDLVTSYDGKAIKTLAIDISKVRLFDDSTPASGLLNGVEGVDLNTLARPATAIFNIPGVAANDKIVFNMTDGTNDYALEFTAPAGLEQGNRAAFVNAINADTSVNSLVQASLSTDGRLVLTSKVAGLNFDDATPANVSATIADNDPATAGAQAATAAVATVSDWGTGSGSIETFLTTVDNAINSVTSGSAMLGANKALLESQEEFIGALSDSLTAGVSAFIDADMNEVSTRNQALQTQQQLGVQALSMANQNSQMILKLFQ